jgi:hypothetical protein
VAGSPAGDQKYTDLYLFDDLHYARPDCAENGHEAVAVMAYDQRLCAQADKSNETRGQEQ